MARKTPTSRAKAVQTALALAITVLQDERVRAQLRRAPTAAREWAEDRRDLRDGTASPSDRLHELNPANRFGQRGIERRLDALQRNVRLAFPTPSAHDAVAVYRAIDELDRAASISASMPVTKRRAAHRRITAELDRLEAALVDAVLPS